MSRSLVIRSPLLPGESLASLLLRLAKENCYDSPRAVMQLCRQQLYGSDNITRPTQTETYQALEELLQIDSRTLHQATVYGFAHVLNNPKVKYETLELPGGQTVILAPAIRNRDNFRENDTQFCPLCLQERAYHRLIWIPKSVAVCLKHRCLLVYKCPNCEYSLNVQSLLESRCRICGLSLTLIEPLSVAHDDHGLLSQRIIQAWFRNEPYQPEGILNQAPPILYRVADGLYSTIKLFRDWSLMHHSGCGDPADPRDEFNPVRRYQVFATVIKALLDWPRGFHKFLDAFLLRQGRSMSYRIDDDFGYIFTKCIRIHWNHDDFQAVHKAFDDYLIDNFALSSSLIHLDRSQSSPDFRERLPYITVSAAAKILGITPDSMLYLAQGQGMVTYQKAKGQTVDQRSFTLVKRSEVLGLKKKWEEGVTVNEAAETIGTSCKVVRQMLRKKLMRAVRGLEEDGSHTWLINFNSLYSLLSRLRLKALHPASGKTVPIVLALQRLSAYRVNMADIVEYVLSDQLRAYWAKEAERLEEMVVLQEDVTLLLTDLATNQPLLTRQKIAQRMGVKITTVTAWVEKGLIVPEEQKRDSMYFSREEVARFEHDVISTEEAARILQVTELAVQSWTRRGRLCPISGPGVDERAAYLFRRDEIVRLRPDNRCTAPEMADRLGISRSHLRAWIDKGKIKPISGPGIDQCGRYLFTLDEEIGE